MKIQTKFTNLTDISSMSPMTMTIVYGKVEAGTAALLEKSCKSLIRTMELIEIISVSYSGILLKRKANPRKREH
jgi:DNA-binding Xre family transcriptional regulator